MKFSKGYTRFHWASLIFIYLVIIAGSVVRTSGSGMGCPDWPKCFGQWVPPTDESQLPEGTQEQLLEKRLQKAEKFASLLDKVGLSASAEKLRNDPYLQLDEPFNASRTWTEYANRLVGFVAGNLVLILFVWTFVRYRKNRKLLVLTFLNLLFISFEGWFGSIVV
ncbi:MAG: COX15/CtaA family protein, partial [Bacteroidetes bacterium]|nr:COX15/CtaA family protein [Bacteroidota bacterium]